MSRKYEYVKLPSATIHIREARAGITLCGQWSKSAPVYDPLSPSAASLCKTCARIKLSQEKKENQ